MAIDWQGIEAAVTYKAWIGYATELRQRANRAKEENDTVAFSEFNILAEVTGYHQDFENPEGPFLPAYVHNGQRSSIPSDLTEEQLQVLRTVAPTTEIPAIRARLRDVLWVRAKDHEAGRLGILDYLTNAELKDTGSVEAYDSIERAVQLTITLDRKNIAAIVSRIEQILDEAVKRKDGFLTCKIIECLIERKIGDTKKHIDALDASISNNGLNYTLRNRLLVVKSRCYKVLGEQENERNTAIEAANVFESEADTYIGNNSFSVASHYLLQAIAAHKRIGGQQAETERLHKKLLDVQSKGMDEFGTISTEIEIEPSHIEDARNFVSGKSNWAEAMIAIVRAHRLTPFQSIRTNFEKSVEGTVMWKIAPTQITDKDGRILGIIPPVSSLTGDELEAAMFYHYSRYASLLAQINAFQLSVMREQIVNEHVISESDLAYWLQSSQFVPPLRERLFAKGIIAGLNGNWVVCIHLLIPQLESAIRYHLRIQGNRVSYLNSEFVQDAAPLGTVLRDFREELIRIFGEDIFFWLRCLVGDKEGSNLRNRISHGLMDQEDFHPNEIEYFWWFILRLCLLHFAYPPKQEKV